MIDSPIALLGLMTSGTTPRCPLISRDEYCPHTESIQSHHRGWDIIPHDVFEREQTSNLAALAIPMTVRLELQARAFAIQHRG